MEGQFTISNGFDNATFQMEDGTNKNPVQKEVSTKVRKKSFFDVFPRLENYRTSMRSSNKRPSLGELHGSGEQQDKQQDTQLSVDVEKQQKEHVQIKLGWIQGVLIPCLLNIWGVMLFLRLSWVVAEAGVGHSLVIIGISAVVCVITTLSLSAISTNGEVKGGGIYYIISRSLGPEFGASVGIVFAFANAVSASMNTIGFCNSLTDLVTSLGGSITGGELNDARVVGTAATVVMILICAVGMEWESKAQNFLIAIILGAMVDFIVGTIIGPLSDDQQAKGFVGFNSTVFAENWYPAYRPQDNQNYDFFQVFAIFFPSVTGIQAGANISGDLKDPASAIPKGTLLALLISMFSYALFVFFAGGAALRDASGQVLDLHSGNLTSCLHTTSGCQYGLFNSYQMMQIMSSWGPFIYAGCFAATLSTALTNLLSVPRLIQALGIDRIYPGLIYFSKGYGKHNEPYRGYVLTLLVSVLFLLIADLNMIAPLISNFYLASYALINFCTFHAALIKPLGWRPTFKYYNTWLSLFGFISCVVIMFLINWISSLITFIVILGLYLVVVYRKPDVNWGSSTQAQTYKTALTTAQRLIGIGEHVKNYNPQILVLCGSPKIRPPLVDFANLITKNHALLIVGDVVDQKLSYKVRATRTHNVYKYLKSHKIKAFYSLIESENFEDGAKALVQATGIGKLSPNVVMMGYKNDWIKCSTTDLSSYFNVLHAAFSYRLSVAILRTPECLDYSDILRENDSDDDNQTISNSSVEGTVNTSKLQVANITSGIMHSDSNLALNIPQKNTRENTPKLTKKKMQKKEKILEQLALNLPPDQAAKLDSIERFRKKQNKGFIDVWWLYDDGGLTMLLPYIISNRQDWSSCKLRVFALTNNHNDLESEEKNMAHMLSKFRLKYYSLKLVSVAEKPQESTVKFFNDLLDEYKNNHNENDCQLTEDEIISLNDKTHRQLRLRELLLEYSVNSNLIVMSLPMPRMGTVSAPLYMAWLETVTRGLPPFLLVRGNQQSVLTFYS